MDRLEQLIRMQHRLQEDSYGIDFGGMSNDERVKYIKDMVLAAQAELHEVLDETFWKPWTTPQGDAFRSRGAYLGELVDVLHFVINLLLALGDDPGELTTEIFTRYALKNRVNAKRQVEGYDGITTKCSHCGRALDDPAVSCTYAACNAVDATPELAR